MVYYTGPISDHFDGQKFHNREKVKKSLLRLLHWRLTRKPVKWPKHITNKPYLPPPDRVLDQTIQITFINHATVLIQTHGLNILTDPVWSKRVSPFKYIGPKRVKNPGVDLDKLPKIDIILLSHDHYDHLDINTLIKLEEKFSPTIYAGLGIDNLLKENKLHAKVITLDWWQNNEIPLSSLNAQNVKTSLPETSIGDTVKIHFVPAKHWSGRKLIKNVNSTLWGGFVIETPTDKIFFAGDTAYDQHFKQLQQKFHEFTLALLPIGAYKPRDFMSSAHTTPYEAVLAHQDLNTKHSMAIHFGTFNLSDEGYDQPVKDLDIALEEKNISKDMFRVLDEGETWKI